ncbi:DUF6708 domain-containing protein [Alloalcanivorax xenomutans]|uniref:DUF6708 domain-containing protein n=1 Tax=Alloalcanivorax xenomutans TaxID=1094342 RepID=UPI003BAC137A
MLSDYTGLGRNAYKVNRPLEQEEKTSRLSRDRRWTDEPPNDEALLIKINSTYLEMVDRWYWQKGQIQVFTLTAFLMLVGFSVALLFFPQGSDRGLGRWAFDIFFSLLFLGLAWAIWKGMRMEIFAYTHYPVRLNRKNRMVYAFRTDGTVIRAPWDDLFLHIGEGTVPTVGTTYDIRAHVLDDDGVTVKDTFTLAYPGFLTGKNDLPRLMRVGEYVRRYMEEPDGVKKNAEYSMLFNPVEGRREGIHWSLIRAFAPSSRYPWLQLLFSMVFSLFFLGRWLTMLTCKVPVWPEEIEEECKIEVDDPYRKDASNNPKFGFLEGPWLVICVLTGLAVLAWVLVKYSPLSLLFSG